MTPPIHIFYQYQVDIKMIRIIKYLTKIQPLLHFSFPNVTEIESNKFEKLNRLTAVSFPKATKIGDNSFYGCTNLQSINFPICHTIGKYAFYNCQSLLTASFPETTVLKVAAFTGCTKLREINFPNVTYVHHGVFNSCLSLTDVSLPSIKHLRQNAFIDCTNLTTVNFPEFFTMEENVFNNCISLTNVYAPKGKTVLFCNDTNRYGFDGCMSLIENMRIDQNNDGKTFPPDMSIDDYVYKLSNIIREIQEERMRAVIFHNPGNFFLQFCGENGKVKHLPSDIESEILSFLIPKLPARIIEKTKNYNIHGQFYINENMIEKGCSFGARKIK